MRDRYLSAVGGLAFVLLLPAAAPGAVATFGYGEIQIKVVSEPLGEARLGYAVYSFKIDNTSKQKTHTVTIVLPQNDNFGGENTIRSIRRSVEIGANDSVAVSLYQPPAPAISGRDGRVFIDGKLQEQPLTLETRNLPERAYGHGYGYPSKGTMGTIDNSNPSLVLISPGVKQEMLDIFRGCQSLFVPPRGDAGKDAMPGEGFPGVTFNHNAARPSGSMRDWPAHWLGYSRYEGIVLTRINLLEIPESARPALWQYVETGGVLLVVGEGAVADGWKAEPEKDTPGYKVYRPGFGVCVVAPEQHLLWTPEVFLTTGLAWKQTSNSLRQSLSVQEANRWFPVVDDIGIPVRGLFVMMLLFSIIIGPVNITLLSRWKRRIWLLWTVPALSVLTVLAVFGYMFLSEGWSRHLRIETLTILDENSRRATTLGWTAFYSPVTPGDGLHFSYDTEATQQGEMVEMDPYGRVRGGSRRNCYIDLTNEQHFDRGWVSARVPSHFQVRKSETRLERVTVRKNKDGGYSIVNGLGADINKFWFADEQGRLHSAAEVEAGAQTKLTLTESRLETGKQSQNLRSLYHGEWLSAGSQLRAAPGKYLRPLTYLADVNGSPFLEEALKNSKDRKMSGLVLGLVRELDHED